jgi:hypothetical protein
MVFILLLLYVAGSYCTHSGSVVLCALCIVRLHPLTRAEFAKYILNGTVVDSKRY